MVTMTRETRKRRVISYAVDTDDMDQYLKQEDEQVKQAKLQKLDDTNTSNSPKSNQSAFWDYPTAKWFT